TGAHVAASRIASADLAGEPHSRASALAAAVRSLCRRARRLLRLLSATDRAAAWPAGAAHAAQAHRLQRYLRDSQAGLASYLVAQHPNPDEPLPADPGPPTPQRTD